MNYEELMNKAITPEAPLGTSEAIFDSIHYVTEPNLNTGEVDVTAAYINFKDIKSIKLNLQFDTGSNQLDYLLEQLGAPSYIENDINAASGTTVKMSRWKKEKNSTLSGEALEEFKNRKAGQYFVNICEHEDGSADITETYINTNFNVKTIW